MPGDVEHIVKPNDCLSKIAKEYGFTWETIWNYGPNADLKKKRKDPNILMPGDIVIVPAIKDKKESKGIDQKHPFKRKREQTIFRLRLLIDGNPLKSLPGSINYVSGGKDNTKPARTDEDGHLLVAESKEIKLPGDTVSAMLFLGPPDQQFRYNLLLGRLAPYDQLLGVQQRLNNLGYEVGREDGKMGPRTRAAVYRFQKSNDLTEDGIPGPQTQGKLKEIYGC